MHYQDYKQIAIHSIYFYKIFNLLNMHHTKNSFVHCINQNWMNQILDTIKIDFQFSL